MGRVYLEYDNGVPQLACTFCGGCDSVMGRSMAGILNRGCCHYFPEFSLAEIQRMIHITGGREALEIILGNPETVVNNFSIHAKGQFYKDEYEKYIASGKPLETGSIKDHTIFFRTCPFVKEGWGCIFPVRFRTTVCNFFICAEILERPELQQEFEEYIMERSRYSRWIYRESTDLQHILIENNVNLVIDFAHSLKLLAEIPLSIYDFPKLPPIEFPNSTSI